MARFEDKAKAIALRKQEMSYSQIKRILGVSKSTLSLWLRGMPLSKERILNLRGRSERRIELYREAMRNKRTIRRKAVFYREQKQLLPLTKKELYVAGLFLYWGEGGKTIRTEVTFSNTDPHMLKFYLVWLKDGLGAPTSEVKVKLHLYVDMDIAAEIEYWSNELGLPLYQFKTPYIKKSTLKSLTYKTRGHGTCNLILYGRDWYEKVMLGIQAICGEFRGLE